MDSKQISSILQSCPTTSKDFRGVFPLDYLNKYQGPGVYVCNTDPSHLPGQHWVVIAVSPYQKGEYFDSFGLQPQKAEFLHFLKKNTDLWTYNRKTIQHPFSTVCGHYCVLYALNFSKGLSMNHLLSHFNENLYENDSIVHDYVKSTFGIDVPLVDLDIVANQIGY